MVTPKSPIGKAFEYCANRWISLQNYLTDGMLEIDSNLVENSIRPLALGRKNYLFAGSHDAAKDIAMFYSFLIRIKGFSSSLSCLFLFTEIDSCICFFISLNFCLIWYSWSTLDVVSVRWVEYKIRVFLSILL